MLEFIVVIAAIALYLVILLVLFGKGFFTINFDEKDLFDESVFYKNQDQDEENEKGEK